MAFLKVVATQTEIDLASLPFLSCAYKSCKETEGELILVEMIGDCPDDALGQNLIVHDRCLRRWPRLPQNPGLN